MKQSNSYGKLTLSLSVCTSR